MSVLVGARPFTQLGGASGGTYQEMSKDRWNFAAGCARSRGSTIDPLRLERDAELHKYLSTTRSLETPSPLGRLPTTEQVSRMPYSHPNAMYPQAPHYSSCSPSHRIPQSLAVPEVSGPVQLHTGEVNHDQKVFVASSSATTALPTQEASPVVRKRKFQEDIATPALSWDEDEDEEYDACSRSDDEAAGVLYIGNFSQVKEFFYRRFDELTTKPLRTVVTAWVKILEPRRQSNYGPYHKKLSSERPPEHTPPRWPSNVPYNEPSHLSKHDLNALAVDVIFQHRAMDESKRSGPWITKLQRAAEYAVETTPVESFSSSKSLDFNQMMKARAINEILPSLFDIAQAYEDHVIRCSVFEGLGKTDPGDGTHHSWQAIAKPTRRVCAKKRHCAAGASRGPDLDDGSETHGEDSPAKETDIKISPQQGRMKTRRGVYKKGKFEKCPAGPFVGQVRPHITSKIPSPLAIGQGLGPRRIPAQSGIGLNTQLGYHNLSDSRITELHTGHATPGTSQTLLQGMYTISPSSQPVICQPEYIGRAYSPQDSVTSSNDSSPAYYPESGFGILDPFSPCPGFYPPFFDQSAFKNSTISGSTSYPCIYRDLYSDSSMPNSVSEVFHELPR